MCFFTWDICPKHFVCVKQEQSIFWGCVLACCVLGGRKVRQGLLAWQRWLLLPLIQTRVGSSVSSHYRAASSSAQVWAFFTGLQLHNIAVMFCPVGGPTSVSECCHARISSNLMVVKHPGVTYLHYHPQRALGSSSNTAGPVTASVFDSPEAVRRKTAPPEARCG